MEARTRPVEISNADRRRIAFLNPDAMGDLVLRQPLFEAVAADGHGVTTDVLPVS